MEFGRMVVKEYLSFEACRLGTIEVLGYSLTFKIPNLHVTSLILGYSLTTVLTNFHELHY